MSEQLAFRYKPRRPRVGDIVRTRELCIDGRLVTGRVRRVVSRFWRFLEVDGARVSCSLKEAVVISR